MNLLEKNLSLLRQQQPETARVIEGLVRSSEVECLKTRQGMPVHRYRKKLLHSLRDPYHEARLIVEKCESVPTHFFGFGDGYHLEAFLENEAVNQLTVIEPDGELFRTILEDRDLTHILGKISLIVAESPAQAAEKLNSDKIVWHLHPTYSQLQSRYFEALQALITYKHRSRERLNILVVGPVYGGSYPIACYVRDSLKELGHTVSFVDFTAFYPGYKEIRSWEQSSELLSGLEQLLSWFIEQRIKTFFPDLILFLAQAPVHEESLKKIRAEGISVAYWFVEDYRIMSYWKRLAPCTDAFFTIQREGQDTIRREGAPYVRYLPTAASPDIHAPITLSPEERRLFGSGVSFVGAGYPNRRRFFERLTSLDLKIWGNEWNDAPAILDDIIQQDGRRVSTEETVKIFNASQINFNLHSSPYHEEIDPYGDMVNPRTFEIASCNAFQLVDRRSLFGELFTEKEMVVFEDRNDALEKTEYFLEHEDARRQYAQKGRQRVLKEHTYTLRMQELLGVLFERGLQGRISERTTADLIEEAQLPELHEYFSNFPDQTGLNLEDIASAVRTRKQFLTEDRIWLALQAFKEAAECKKSSF